MELSGLLRTTVAFTQGKEPVAHWTGGWMGPTAGLCVLENPQIVPNIFSLSLSLCQYPCQDQKRFFCLFYVCTPNRALWCVGHVITHVLTTILVLPSSLCYAFIHFLPMFIAVHWKCNRLTVFRNEWEERRLKNNINPFKSSALYSTWFCNWRDFYLFIR